ncbi:peptidoglycan DD-metalloendopeptidase family protein [Clostridiaceae bacterium WCA-383-APC-5B]|uniref:Peptidoglycan DD-metalloendopeptidase family protein n=3 Tax=Inconstantimicrobium porci TaxID=2652291 RepID=A0A7X2MYX8_9CLOT|nr:peptidoglycan DD-metalloendopeptidase family protein [Inconstantimicrobium porci]
MIFCIKNESMGKVKDVLQIIKIIMEGCIMDKIKKNIKAPKLLCLIFPLFMWFSLDRTITRYEVKNQGIIVGYVNDKGEADKAYNELKNEIAAKYSNVRFPQKDISFRVINDTSINASSVQEIKENLKKTLDIEVDAYDMYLNNKEIAIISSRDDGRKILQSVGDSYIKDLKLKEANVKSVDIDTKSTYKKVRVQLSKIISNKDAAKRIKEINKTYPVVNVHIDAVEKIQEIKKEDTVMMPDSTMYIGNMRMIKGSPGKAVIDKQIAYVNGIKNSEKTIKENVTIPAIDTIVYHGVKNPIADGVPFLQRPSRGIITSNYGRRYGATHHGIDIAACYGSNIGAALDGVVNETGYNSVYGYYVKVNHGGGIETLYGHSSKILVQKGDVIKKGDTIALVGSTGNSTGPHIHFELRTNGVAINPAKYIM